MLVVFPLNPSMQFMENVLNDAIQKTKTLFQRMEALFDGRLLATEIHSATPAELKIKR